MKNASKLMIGLLLLLSLAGAAAGERAARDITAQAVITAQSGFDDFWALTDGSTAYAAEYRAGSSITFACDDGIAGVYLLFGAEYGAYTVTDTASGTALACGQYGFLHDYVDLEAAFGSAPREVRLDFTSGPVSLLELTLYSTGTLPDSVQRWEPPADGNADIVLFSAHSDDEQLFLGCIVPSYCARGYTVQLVYMTNHWNMSDPRCSEALDGLWAVGCRTYPVFGEAPDIYSEDLYYSQTVYANNGWPQEKLEAFVVENLRRFRPLAAVGHDLNGEYGHGAHMMYADLLTKAVVDAADSGFDPESAERWGVWDTPKTYLHLYGENPIVLDFDEPLEALGGLTAYEITRDAGFPAHKSQYDLYSWYFWGKEKAADITLYSPCEYGLVRSTVGADEEKNDFLENTQSVREKA